MFGWGSFLGVVATTLISGFVFDSATLCFSGSCTEIDKMYKLLFRSVQIFRISWLSRYSCPSFVFAMHNCSIKH